MVRNTLSEYPRGFDSEILRVKKRERHNLARELHDEMGQYLTAIHYYATSIVRLNETASIDDSANAIDHITYKLLDIIHKKIKQLRSEEFAEIELNFIENISQMIRDWRKNNSCISVDVQTTGIFTDVDSNVLLTVFRLTQECLTNISRHAKASSVLIRIRRVDGYIVLNVVDNGNGFDINRKTGRFGIVGMRERVAERNGVLKIVTSIGTGVNVSVHLPCLILSEGEKQ
ncbi:MAG: hypothetical protein COA83_10115 [Methylophaga sp.]|nr:MAG: hypothetical protein COA83_10115 [Methylophaga sp.]